MTSDDSKKPAGAAGEAAPAQTDAGVKPDAASGPQIPRLHRVTTEYDEKQDRIRLTGQTSSEGECVLWGTRRLLVRLLPRLFEWLEREVPDVMAAEVIQEFRQQKATAALEPQAPVRASDGASEWLLTSVDISMGRGGVRLIFKGDAEDQRVALLLSAQQLRQWLGVLHGRFRRAEWPMDVWPGWMQDARASTPAQTSLH